MKQLQAIVKQGDMLAARQQDLLDNAKSLETAYELFGRLSYRIKMIDDIVDVIARHENKHAFCIPDELRDLKKICRKQIETVQQLIATIIHNDIKETK
jgi:archaellum component FlaC